MTNALAHHLATHFQTPLYVYDFDKITYQFQALKDAFKARKSLICYALKANSNLSLIHHLATLGAGGDCVSIGEVRRALKAGVPKYKIIFSGVGKSDSEISLALELDILFLNIESEAEMKHIEAIAKTMNKIARISIRVNPNIDPKTHPYISTGLHENKFGVDIECAKAMYIYAKKSPYLEPVGIHFHIGSQLTSLEPITQSAEKIAALTHNLLALKIDLKFFDIGGGLGISYTDENTILPYDYAQAILNALRGLDLTIICEPGRFLVGECGTLLTRVLYEKQHQKPSEVRGHEDNHSKNGKRFVIVDAAMNDLIRPTLYQATHQVEVFKKHDANPLELNQNLTLCDVVGPICESGDYLAKNIALPALEAGDILSFSNAGAYGFSMASNYNSRPRAAEVALQGGQLKLIRQRESFEELIANETKELESGLWQDLGQDLGHEMKKSKQEIAPDSQSSQSHILDSKTFQNLAQNLEQNPTTRKP